MSNWRELCNIPSNCEMCRSNPVHRRAVGWPDVCPDGHTESILSKLEQDSVTQIPQDIIEGIHLRGFVEVEKCNSGQVLERVPCCNNQTRPLRMKCEINGEIPAVNCLSCKKWAETY